MPSVCGIGLLSACHVCGVIAGRGGLVVTKGHPILLAGAAAEDWVMERLKQLTDTFTVYNQVDIPNAKSRTGFNEADIIVVGPNAVFVIKVKHNNGHIRGADSDSEWRLRVASRKGQPCWYRLQKICATP